METEPEIEYPRLEIVVAADRNLGIAKENKLPWRLPTELAYYKRLTTSPAGSAKVHASIYATKTWNSIPETLRPWGNTICFILSRSMTAEDVRHYRDVYVHSSFQDIIDHLCQPEIKQRIDRIWMHGGVVGYTEAFRSKHFYRLYMTKIDAEFECDVFFPRVDESCLRIVEDPSVPKDVQTDNGLSYRICVYGSTGKCPLIER